MLSGEISSLKASFSAPKRKDEVQWVGEERGQGGGHEKERLQAGPNPNLSVDAIGP